MATERWVVYSTFDANGAAAPFAEAQVAAYRELGFRTLVVDTSPEPSAERIAAWQRCSTAWLKRLNEGYDFGSYRHGLTVLLDEYGMRPGGFDLLLTNDSCYGPYTPLADVFRAFDAAPRDGKHVFGMTDSHELEHHLQSYWLYFPAEAVHHACDFLFALGRIVDRDQAIVQGEIGLSRLLLGRGCTLVAYQSDAEIIGHFARFNGWLPSFVELAWRWRMKRPRFARDGDKACLQALLGKDFAVNPTLAFGTHLHFESMLPFVKRQLVRENPLGDPAIPVTPPTDPRDNVCIDRWLRSTPVYERRYGRRGDAERIGTG